MPFQYKNLSRAAGFRFAGRSLPLQLKKNVTDVVEVCSVLDEVVPGQHRDEHFVVVVAQTAANLQHHDVLVEAVAPAPVLLDVVHLNDLVIETDSLEIKQMLNCPGVLMIIVVCYLWSFSNKNAHVTLHI